MWEEVFFRVWVGEMGCVFVFVFFVQCVVGRRGCDAGGAQMPRSHGCGDGLWKQRVEAAMAMTYDDLLMLRHHHAC